MNSNGILYKSYNKTTKHGKDRSSRNKSHGKERHAFLQFLHLVRKRRTSGKDREFTHHLLLNHDASYSTSITTGMMNDDTPKQIENPSKDKVIMTGQQRDWRTAVDPKSGRTYYYDAITRETQWRKPLELATKAERARIQEKERMQLEFFRSMESNILAAVDRGQMPGIEASKEDVVKPLPKSNMSHRKIKKPSLIRTISSMDDALVAELSKDIDQASNKGTALISPDSVTSTSFFNSLPQPVQRNPITVVKDDSPPPFAQTSTADRFPQLKRTITPPSPSVSKSLPKPKMAKRNTCGSLYISNTMADPDKDACIKCLCAVYRTHITQSMKDYNISPKYEEYEVFHDEYKMKKSPPTRLDSNAIIVEETYNAIEAMRIDVEDGIPTLDEITHFYRFVFNKAQMESDCIIMSLIYVERLLRETKGGVRPTIYNWRSILFSCMVLASKVWDDLSMWNADFSHACPKGVKFSLQRINQLELALLNCLQYKVKVESSEYAKYYFLMRSMMIRSGLAGQEIMSNAAPLNLQGAKDLAFLSDRKGIQKPPPLKSRSKSDGLDNDAKSSPLRSSQLSLEQVVRM